MNFKKIFKVNFFNIFLFVIIMILKSFYAPAVTGVLLTGWLGFLLYSNYYFIVKSDDKVYELEKSNKGDREFDKIIKNTEILTESIESKTDFFNKMDPTSSMRDTYELVKNRFYQNVAHMTEYMENFDYITNPIGQRERIRAINNENNVIADKLNVFVEEIISVEHSAESVDTSVMDDLIKSLKEVSN